VNRAAALFAIALSLFFAGCAANSDTSTDSRQTHHRKPGPNLDRTYEWGSKPPGAMDATHVRD
jgi:hypothetical protein